VSRIHVFPFARRVRVTVGDEIVADTDRALALDETGLRRRFYIPRGDVRMERLEPTTKETHCPWKGDASYWTVAGVRDGAWSYERPDTDDAQPIAGYLSFDGAGIAVEVAAATVVN
jgi:uncharacterized protein (DUF427 family)